MESSFRIVLDSRRYLTSGGEAGVDGVKFQNSSRFKTVSHIRRQSRNDNGLNDFRAKVVIPLTETTMNTQIGKPVLGVLGGMGGLASAEFVKTVYELSGEICRREQDGPVVVMYSDPAFPDRTEAFLRGETKPILTKLIDALELLRGMGASQFVICCMTIH